MTSHTAFPIEPPSEFAYRNGNNDDRGAAIDDPSTATLTCSAATLTRLTGTDTHSGSTIDCLAAAGDENAATDDENATTDHKNTAVGHENRVINHENRVINLEDADTVHRSAFAAHHNASLDDRLCAIAHCNAALLFPLALDAGRQFLHRPPFDRDALLLGPRDRLAASHADCSAHFAEQETRASSGDEVIGARSGYFSRQA